MHLQFIPERYVQYGERESETRYCVIGWLASQSGVSNTVLEACGANTIHDDEIEVQDPYAAVALTVVIRKIQDRYGLPIEAMCNLQRLNDAGDWNCVEAILRDVLHEPTLTVSGSGWL